MILVVLLRVVAIEHRAVVETTVQMGVKLLRGGELLTTRLAEALAWGRQTGTALVFAARTVLRKGLPRGTSHVTGSATDPRDLPLLVLHDPAFQAAVAVVGGRLQHSSLLGGKPDGAAQEQPARSSEALGGSAG